MWFQFFSWILWIYKNYLCLILITYMQFKFKLVTCNKSFFIFGVKFCHSNSLTLTKRLHNPFYNCNLNSNSLKNWNSHTQMQPATAKYNIPNGWDNHMVYLFFSCIASQKIRRHLSCKLKHAIATYDTFKNPQRKTLQEKHCSQQNIKCGFFVLQYTPSWGKTCTQ